MLSRLNASKVSGKKWENYLKDCFLIMAVFWQPFDRQFGIMQPPGSLPTSEMGCNLERWQLLRPLYWRVTGIKTEKKNSKQSRFISENLVKMFWYGTILHIERVFSFNAPSQILILKWGWFFPSLLCVIKLRFYSQPDSGWSYELAVGTPVPSASEMNFESLECWPLQQAIFMWGQSPEPSQTH